MQRAKWIDVYFDNEFSMYSQTNKINSLGGSMFNSELSCSEIPQQWLMGNYLSTLAREYRVSVNTDRQAENNGAENSV